MIMHWGGIRYRVNGAGNLRMQVIPFDSVNTETPVPIVMTASPGIELFRLTDTMSERVRVKVFTTGIDEKFDINRIVVYARPTFESWPGN